METAAFQQQLAVTCLDTKRLVDRLDRTDILLLRQFYVTGKAYPNDTTSYVLRLLVNDFQKKYCSGNKVISYHTIRHRLENLKALGLVGKIPQTNPAIYYGIDEIANDIKQLILRFAADLVGPNHRRG